MAGSCIYNHLAWAGCVAYPCTGAMRRPKAGMGRSRNFPCLFLFPKLNNSSLAGSLPACPKPLRTSGDNLDSDEKGLYYKKKLRTNSKKRRKKLVGIR